MHLIPREEIYSRIKKLQDLMNQKGWSGMFLNQLVNMLYYSGTMQGMSLFIPNEGEPVLLVRKNLRRAGNESPLENVVQVDRWSELPAILKRENCRQMTSLGLELDFLPAKIYRTFMQLFPTAEVVDISFALREIRMVKSAYEHKFFREAGRLAQEVYDKIPRMIKPGITELALAAEIEYEMRRLGHQGVTRMRGYNQEAFFGHVLFGDNALTGSFFDSPTGGQGLSVACPFGASDTVLEPGKPIMVDYVFVLDGYVVDLTRIFVLGKVPAELQAAHQTAIAVQNKLAEIALPGVKTDYLYQVAQDIVQEHGFIRNFMGTEESRVRFIGHGVGLELDELPIITDMASFTLAEGMTLALEPKFFFPKQGLVGLENTFIVQNDGLEKVCTLSDEIVTIGV